MSANQVIRQDILNGCADHFMQAGKSRVSKVE